LPPVIKKAKTIAFDQLGKLIAMAKQITIVPSILKKTKKQKRHAILLVSLSVSQSVGFPFIPLAHLIKSRNAWKCDAIVGISS
jgi:hypothetical protein